MEKNVVPFGFVLIRIEGVIMNVSAKFFVLFACCFLLLTFAASVPLGIADDHKGGKKHFEKHDAGKAYGVLGGKTGRDHDEGNETTGQLAAWSLGLANLTVVISLLIKTVRRFAPISQETKNSMLKFNNFQKKHLMVFHCVLNPLILTVATLHWTLSKCKATALPEWGLFVMAIIVALGIILKFKICPKNLLRNVYKIHTQPLLPLLFISMLVIGHFAMD